MNDIKNKKFLSLITPTLTTLSLEWFNPQQNPGSACLHCSLNCGRSDKHDDDCLYQVGKDLITKFNEIEASSEYDLSFKKELRPLQEISMIKDTYKMSAVINRLKTDLRHYIPLDYTDPSNEGIACSCCLYSPLDKAHAPECPHPQISLALSELFKP